MKWKVRKKIDKDFALKFPEVNSIILQLLNNREITEEQEMNEFLSPSYNLLGDAFLFSDMKKAVEKIEKAIQEKKKIVIYGDYDADGVTSTAVLSIGLKHLGAEVSIYIPDREKEGYGLNEQAIKKIKEKGAELIITVDCGISSFKEVELIKNLGMDIIITDHHFPPKKVPKCLIINPKSDKKYPFKDLAGVGVAFKLVQALLNNKNEAFEKWLLDLVAIGTIADCMPLIGENRVLTKYGLIVLNKTKRIGLQTLIDGASLKMGEIDSRSVSFRISPRINAAGRMRHASLAYDLLKSKSLDKANERVKKLNEANSERQKLTEKITKSILKEIGENPKDKVIFSLQKECPIGIVGLIAGKVTDVYKRPSFVLTEKDGEIIGSGRSIPSFDLIEILNELKDLFSHFGGHAGACGLTLKSKDLLSEFQKQFLSIANQKLTNDDLESVLNIDAEIDLNDITWGLFNDLIKFAPFGMGNTKPIFLTRNLKLLSKREVGQNGNHLKIFVNESLENSNCSKDCIGFGIAETWRENLKAGDKIDLLYEIDENHWNGNRELQLKVVDLRHSKI
ncbi:single-stranded-DNA-specific exonuclease RecJ [Candidatus Falkowbacteria bacterium]|jgi:single-stranded-DNA-specific exonuclease|nr:single-stranded-DNA-specific exonuclease RecJ [Candidatus Falkowbacteria bacterium]MBT4433477.1 single-stranded-DNA-specific exonuclease RecJ [Candidatus Falkowbacteria bacterium]